MCLYKCNPTCTNTETLSLNVYLHIHQCHISPKIESFLTITEKNKLFNFYIMKSLPVHNKSFSYIIGFYSIMSSYLLNTKLLASCLKCDRVVSATPYCTLWDKTTPSHTNSSFLKQYCYFRLLYLPSFLHFTSPDTDPILIRNLPSSRKKWSCFNWYNRIWSPNLKKTQKNWHV